MREANFSQLIQAWFNGLRQELSLLALWIGILATSGLMSDIYLWDLFKHDNLSLFFRVILTIISLLLNAQCVAVLTRRYLQRHHLLVSSADMSSRIVPVIFISIVYCLGTLLGTFFLIIPGILIAASWFMSVPILFAENISAIEAMRSSWHRSPPQLPLLSLFALFTSLPFLIAISVVVLVDDQAYFALASVITNLLYSVSAVSGTIAAAVSYHILVGNEHRYTEVFS